MMGHRIVRYFFFICRMNFPICSCLEKLRSIFFCTLPQTIHLILKNKTWRIFLYVSASIFQFFSEYPLIHRVDAVFWYFANLCIFFHDFLCLIRQKIFSQIGSNLGKLLHAPSSLTTFSVGSEMGQQNGMKNEKF